MPLCREEVIAKLKERLPWSISTLSLIKDESLKFIYDENCDYVGVHNRYHEWVCYLDDYNMLNKLINCIEIFNEECRIIVYSNESKFDKILLSDSIKNAMYHLEDFMVMENIERNDNTKWTFASKNDISQVAMLQLAYNNEEVDWKYYRNTCEELENMYNEKMANSEIFVIGQPITTKIELCDICNDYAKLTGVYTKEEMRNKGQAKQCIQDVANWAYYNNKKICLNVRSDNISAKRLYSGIGFVKKGDVLYYKLT